MWRPTGKVSRKAAGRRLPPWAAALLLVAVLLPLAVPPGTALAQSGYYWVSNITSITATLNWLDNNCPNGLTILVLDEDSGNEVARNNNSQTSGNWAVTDLSPETQYIARWYCTGSGANKGVNFTTLAGTLPGAPTDLTATGGDKSIYFTWSAPADSGTSPITAYEYSQDNGLWSDIGLKTSHTVLGLTNGQTYSYRVRAVSAIGAGPPSDSASAMTALPTPDPNAPTATPPPVTPRPDSEIPLGSLVIQVGRDQYDDYGYDAAEGYGFLVSGAFPSELFIFADPSAAQPAAVLGVKEETAGPWVLTYGGPAQRWRLAAELEHISLRIRPADGRDAVTVPLSSHLDGDPSGAVLRLKSPYSGLALPSREGQRVTLEFLRINPLLAGGPVPDADESLPTGVVGKFSGLLDEAPGSGIVKQMYITLGVAVALLVLIPNSAQKKPMIILAAVVFTPWVPASIGHGHQVLSACLGMLAVLAWQGWRIWVRPV